MTKTLRLFSLVMSASLAIGTSLIATHSPGLENQWLREDLDSIRKELVDMSNKMDALMERALQRSPLTIHARLHINEDAGVHIDIKEEENKVIARITLPSTVDVESLNLSIELSGILSLSISTHEEYVDMDGLKNVSDTQNVHGFTLPAPVNSQATTAEYENGVLTVVMPKIEHAAKTGITITKK